MANLNAGFVALMVIQFNGGLNSKSAVIDSCLHGIPVRPCLLLALSQRITALRLIQILPHIFGIKPYSRHGLFITCQSSPASLTGGTGTLLQ